LSAAGSGTGLQTRAGIGEVLALQSADGASLFATAHGAHLISWKPASGQSAGEEQFYLSSLAAFGGSNAVRGGVPVIFPQFAGEGPLPKHGFLRNRAWRLLSAEQPASGPATASFEIEDDAATQAIWPHAFRAQLQLQLVGDRLEIRLLVTNTGATAFRFTAALHSYLKVADIADVRIQGLQGLRYRDSAANGTPATESADRLAIVGEVDRIYFDAPPVIELIELQRHLRIESTDFPDAVVWNPGEAKAAALVDLEPGGWRRFVCIESAAIGQPVELEAGRTWQGVQTLIAGG
jgi:glucose-6-phosphate 1-epimerase